MSQKKRLKKLKRREVREKREKIRQIDLTHAPTKTNKST